MRLRAPWPATPRAWTVELRSHTGGLVLVCQRCPHGGGPVTASSARAAALTHLARHARSDTLPLHLRICQCRERGCRWHGRHRGCAGPVRLLLAGEHGGRVWRLADTCTACAAATAHAAVVPDTALLAPRPSPPATSRRRRRPSEPDGRARVREMLSYLAAALPAGASAAARLIALQCALRMNASMQVRLPLGLLRGLRLGATLNPWRELEQARWLRRIPDRAADEVAAVLLDAALLGQAPARTDRRRAADWALRGSCPSRAGVLGPLPQLMSVYLAAHSQSETGHGLNEADRTAHECGIQPAELPHALEQLATAGLLDSWRIASDTEDLHWILGLRSEGEPRVR
ncbi:hypothetical protein [Streptomyces regalis]|uniref:Uncharacterized protein n=1 Tax=Streptomyces regalis TaxID=68262 RepID=A0A117MNS7_9ACTN|nr:hypothetical protein [Streptomyces regalis]KUL27356.1 hypothetical protein ADL12_30385 [Streptomyces regalis]